MDDRKRPWKVKNGEDLSISEFENKVYCIDNLKLLKKIPSESVDLVYIDPPFLTGQKFFNTNGLGFDDKFNSMQTYIEWMKVRVQEIHRILKDTGSIFLHCDWRASHKLRVILDDVFGEKNFVNEIVWCYKDLGFGRNTKYFKKKHDNIYVYAKSSLYFSIIERRGLAESTIKKFKNTFDQDGIITFKRLKEKNPGTFNALKRQKRVPKDLNTICFSKKRGAQLEDWWPDIKPIRSSRYIIKEPQKYPTQKPEALLERIIKSFSQKNDIVADFFCGSGTTPVVAKKLGRRYIACDSNPDAVKITKERLNEIS